MKVVNLYRMMWFCQMAEKQLAWLEKTAADKEIIAVYKEIIKDYHLNIAEIKEQFHAVEEIDQPQSV